MFCASDQSTTRFTENEGDLKIRKTELHHHCYTSYKKVENDQNAIFKSVKSITRMNANQCLKEKKEFPLVLWQLGQGPAPHPQP